MYPANYFVVEIIGLKIIHTYMYILYDLNWTEIYWCLPAQCRAPLHFTYVLNFYPVFVTDPFQPFQDIERMVIFGPIPLCRNGTDGTGVKKSSSEHGAACWSNHGDCLEWVDATCNVLEKCPKCHATIHSISTSDCQYASIFSAKSNWSFCCWVYHVSNSMRLPKPGWPGIGSSSYILPVLKYMTCVGIPLPYCVDVQDALAWTVPAYWSRISRTLSLCTGCC